VIEFNSDTIYTQRWIGIDLNTTGHVAVAADLFSGKVMKLGTNAYYAHSHCSKNCTKLYKSGKLWKLKKIKSKDRTVFKNAIHKISKQIVTFAESLGSGIKFEKLFNSRYYMQEVSKNYSEFSFDNGSFFLLQKMVEKKARRIGIPVIYVNPAYTSKRCSRCGGFGRRYRKRFECPHCGYVVHADVNAAFNIASTSFRSELYDTDLGIERRRIKEIKKQTRDPTKIQVRDFPTFPPTSSVNNMGNLLYVLECQRVPVDCTPT
jgi:putative transposase